MTCDRKETTSLNLGLVDEILFYQKTPGKESLRELGENNAG